MRFHPLLSRDPRRQERFVSSRRAASGRQLWLDDLEQRCLLSIGIAPALTVQGKSLSATEGKPLSAIVATFSDSDGNTSVKSYTATISYGDGSKGTPEVVVDPTVKKRFDVKVTHTYAEEMAKGLLTVQIQDSDGDSAQVSDPLKVADAALTATGLTLTDRVQHTFQNVIVATFTDSDPKGMMSDYSATIVWGDGTSSAGQVVSDPNVAGQFDVVGNHVYPAMQSNATIKTTINDVGGSQSSATTKVVEPSLKVTNVSVSATEGKAVTVTVAKFTDSDPSATPSDFTATITWDDGNKSLGTIVIDSTHANQFDIVGTQTYPEELAKGQVSVQIVGDDGSSGKATDALKVADAALTATGTTLVDQSLHTLSKVIVATFTDADPKGTVSDYVATIFWGDGTSSGAQIMADPKVAHQFDVVGSHKYAGSAFSVSTDRFTVTTKIKDAGGSQAQTTSPILVAQTVTISAKEGMPIEPPEKTKTLTVAAFDSSNPKINLAQYSAKVFYSNGLVMAGTIKASPKVANEYDVSVTGLGAFEEEGTYLILTQITGPKGVKISVPGVINVADAALVNPSLAPPAPVDALVGFNTMFDLGTFVDEDPHGVVSDYSVSINWGDGTPPTAAIVTPGGGSALGQAFDVSGFHAYTQGGNFTATATVADMGGAKLLTPLTAMIMANGGLMVTPVAATEGKPLSNVTVASFFGGSMTPASQFSATIDWGDGQQTTGMIQTAGTGLFQVVGSHTYAEESPKNAPYILQVRVLGLSPNMPTTANAMETVQDAMLVANGAAPTFTTQPGTPLTGVTVASFTDQDPMGTASDYMATIDWGDGTTTPGTIQAIAGNASGSLPSFNVLGDHTYSMSGNFPIKVTIMDAPGSTPLVVTATATVLGTPAGLQVLGTFTSSGDIAGQPHPPDEGARWVIALFDTPRNELLSAYQYSIDWGDGTPPTTMPNFYNELLPLQPGETGEIYDDHIYAVGGVDGNAIDYTITITITGPGIDPNNPLMGTIIEPVTMN